MQGNVRHTATWNPWHGCHRVSEGCRNCYVYRIDARHGKDSSQVTRTASYMLPLQRKKNGDYRISAGTLLYTCFSSDFLVADADEWRQAAWEMMRIRQDVRFLFITKRIDRLAQCLPPDWGAGYENVSIGCTIENQAMCDYRLPYFLAAPIRHKFIVCEPLLGKITLPAAEGIEEVIAGGESGSGARPCHYEHVLDLRRQCAEQGIAFHFKQTGAVFVKDGRTYRIARPDQIPQARKANIDL